MARLVIEQFGVYENPHQTSAKRVPFVVVVQSDHLYKLDTVVVVPLARQAEIATGALTPRFDVEHESLVLLPHQIAFMPRRLLTRRVASLEGERDRIIRALDFMLLGL